MCVTALKISCKTMALFVGNESMRTMFRLTCFQYCIFIMNWIDVKQMCVEVISIRDLRMCNGVFQVPLDNVTKEGWSLSFKKKNTCDSFLNVEMHLQCFIVISSLYMQL